MNRLDFVYTLGFLDGTVSSLNFQWATVMDTGKDLHILFVSLLKSQDLFISQADQLSPVQPGDNQLLWEALSIGLNCATGYSVFEIKVLERRRLV